MTDLVRLDVSLSLSTFWCGGPIPLAITIENRDDARPLAVPVPFAPSCPAIRFVLRRAGDTAPIALGPAFPGGVRSVQVPPAEVYLTETSLTAWHTFEPGAYTLEVSWAHGASEARAAPVRFEVVAPDAMALAIVPGSFPEAPPSLSAVSAISGPGLGVLVEGRFLPDIEDDTTFRDAGEVIRFVTALPVLAPIPVLAAAAPEAWVAWSTGDGLFARPGHDVEGAAEAKFPAESRVDVIAPAVETREGELLVYSLRGNGPRRELVETRFTAPLVAIEEPEGPDDWDDEIRVPGPAHDTTIGEIEVGEGTATLARAGEDDLRVLALSASAEAGVLVQACVRGRAVSAFARLDLPGAPLPRAVPAAFVDGAGDTVVAVALARRGPTPERTLTVGVALARFGASEPPTVEVVWLGSLPEAPTSAVVAFSCVEPERPFFRCAVLCADGSLFVGDRAGSWAAHAPPGELLTPLALTTCVAHAHVGVRGPNGPTLRRLFPR